MGLLFWIGGSMGKEQIATELLEQAVRSRVADLVAHGVCKSEAIAHIYMVALKAMEKVVEVSKL